MHAFGSKAAHVAARLLNVITPVRADEIWRSLALASVFFLLFSVCYIVKPLKESLILSLHDGAQLKSYTSAIQSLIFIGLVPIYSALASRFSGRRVLIFIYCFLASHLVAFAVFGRTGGLAMGIIYFVWVGIFNLLIISQTWSAISDGYAPEQGKRLFPLIAFGATSGAVFGSAVFSAVLSHMGLFRPMILAAAMLCLCAGIVRFAVPGNGPVDRQASNIRESFQNRLFDGFGLVFSNRYLTLIALSILLCNFVNTNAEYILGKLVASDAHQKVQAGLAPGMSVPALIAHFYSRLYFWANLTVLILQVFVVSRVVRWLGMQAALLIVPILALMSYSLIIVLPLLPIIRVVKIMENAANYSLNNTAREILFLPVQRREKYKAKLATDTCFWRGGDALSGLAVAVLTGILGLHLSAFAGLNIVLVIIWIGVVRNIAARRKALLAEQSSDS